MIQLQKASEPAYMLNGVLVFNVTELGKILGITRQTARIHIKKYSVEPVAIDAKGNALYSVSGFMTAQSESGAFGGYASALEWKNAISAKRDQLKLDADEGKLYPAAEVNQIFTKNYMLIAAIGKEAMMLVDNELHPDGLIMEEISKKLDAMYLRHWEKIQAGKVFR